MKNIRVAAIQMDVSPDKQTNLNNLDNILSTMVDKSIDIVVLPEMFLCPYQSDLFAEYSEAEGEYTWQTLSEIAAKYSIYLIAGSVPEKEGNSIFNTSYVFNRQGKQIGKHRKMHLFDIDVENGQSFKESDTLTAGNEVTVFETEFGNIGICICYDFRFPELSRLMIDKGAQVIIVPAAFNMTTGPSHWDILFRTRALDNQVYTIGVAPARNKSAGYTSWGHSLVVSPWGEIINQLNESEGCMIVDIDLDFVSKVRKELPLLVHRRNDLYSQF